MSGPQRLLRDILRENGFQEVLDRGLVTGVREDGARLSLFTWGNDREASRCGIPRAYVVVVMPNLRRYRLPTVEWVPGLPVEQQLPRPSADVLAEFADVFTPALSSGGSDALADPRYELR